jgi:L-glyceraldehyde 3-phosphate reductase
MAKPSVNSFAERRSRSERAHRERISQVLPDGVNPPGRNTLRRPMHHTRKMPFDPRLGLTHYVPAPGRYDNAEYRRCGRSGLRLPPISLGLWQNFGDDRPLADSRAMLRRAFDLGITHFDLANNYGPPYGTAEINFGRIFAEDFRARRDELVISTKAGYDMWAGPYGEWGSRKYMLASLDASLARMGLEYVDIFYSHRFDPETPLEETMGALDAAVCDGKARYVGISSYGPRRTEEAIEILRHLGTPLLIHQPSYSMFNRWVEDELLEVLAREGVGSIVFSPLAQGLLTDKYLDGVPRDSRVKRGLHFSSELITDENLQRVRSLAQIANRRGQSLAQMAIAWVLRDPRVTSALVGASSVAQLEQNVAALESPDFDDSELEEIDQYAVDGAINIWAASSDA